MTDYSRMYKALLAEGIDEHEAAARVDRLIARNAAKKALAKRGIDREPTAREIEYGLCACRRKGKPEATFGERRPVPQRKHETALYKRRVRRKQAWDHNPAIPNMADWRTTG